MTLGIISLVRLSWPGGDAMPVVLVACRIGLIRAESNFGPSIEEEATTRHNGPTGIAGK